MSVFSKASPYNFSPEGFLIRQQMGVLGSVKLSTSNSIKSSPNPYGRFIEDDIRIIEKEEEDLKKQNIPAGWEQEAIGEDWRNYSTYRVYRLDEIESPPGPEFAEDTIYGPNYVICAKGAVKRKQSHLRE